MDLSDNVKARLKTARACEKLKKMLGTVSEAEITVDNLADGLDFHERSTRAELESLAEPLITRLNALIARAIGDSAVSVTDLNAVEVIGGGSRVPIVKDCISKAFQRDLSFTLDGAAAVALGAALAPRIAAGQSTINVNIPSTVMLPEGHEPELHRMAEDEKRMDDTDAQVVLAGVRKNELESFIFELRSQLNGVLKDSVSETVRI